jgi:hypothetical protein
VHEVLALPLYGDLALNDVKIICQMLRSFYKGKQLFPTFDNEIKESIYV